MKRNVRLLLLASGSLHGKEVMEWCSDLVHDFFKSANVMNVLFIPYAKQDYEKYYKTMTKYTSGCGIKLESIHDKQDPVTAVQEAKGIYIGGGNTFLLLKTLYEKNLIEPIRQAVLENGIPFLGSSAGSNVATPNIKTTNDMPIVYPPSFDALNLVPFNINPHYLDKDPNSKHCGETREERLKEFHQHNSTPVLGLREGCSVLINDGKATVKGVTSARLFQMSQAAVEYEPESDVSFLLEFN